MFQKEKPRYLTKGVGKTISLVLQVFLWEAVDKMPEPKDYLQVFQLSEKNGLQIIHHTSEQPHFKRTYVLSVCEKAITAKVYLIDDGEQCTMLLADEY